jgi:hypothetical protein
VAWSTSREEVERLAREHDLGSVRTGVVAKRDVLGNIRLRGEEEIFALPEHVSLMG